MPIVSTTPKPVVFRGHQGNNGSTFNTVTAVLVGKGISRLNFGLGDFGNVGDEVLVLRHFRVAVN